MTYKEDGSRRLKGTTRFAYDLQKHLIGEYSTAGVAQKEYVWLGDEVVAVLSYQ